MTGVSSMLSIGKKALFSSQSALEVVGNNISNANTEGYSRQSVRFEDGYYLNRVPGQLGTGADAAEVMRSFDEFVEAQYNTKSSEQQRWQKLYESLQQVEMLLNESNSEGVNSVLNEFWADWQNLADNPDSTSARSALLGHASNLERVIQTADEDMRTLQKRADEQIAQDVDEINGLLQSIADLNKQVAISEVPGKINANGLRDQRATLVRQLAEKVDIHYIENGSDSVTITTAAGQTLVDNTSCFRLAFEGPQVIPDLTDSSAFDGTLNFEGSGNYEYSVEIVTAGTVGGGAQFRVSTDGGRTWLADENGTDTFSVNDYANRVTLPDGSLAISFTGTGNLEVGDKFQVLPKKSLFWYETTTSKVNVTPQLLPNGQDDESRLTGGTLTGYVQFRDTNVGGYLEKLNAFAESLAWEVNRIHSQGAGRDRFQGVTGTNTVTSVSTALNNASSGLSFGDKLSGGNVTLAIYNHGTGALEQSQSLDFDSATPGIQNFDPATHTLEDVRAVFDGLNGVSASIQDGRLQLTADTGKDFAFVSDSTGLLAALGINTFFEGTNARNLAINSMIQSNLTFVNTGRVNGAGEVNSGDNATALAIAALQGKDVATTTVAEGTSRQTLDEYFATLVSKVGSDTQNAKFNFDYHSTLATDLKARQDAVSGVNLDEEMTNLIKFQHAYTAAAKLITTAESMLEVLLGLKS